MQHIVREQLTARDDAGGQHRILVTRVPVPGAAHLHGPARYSWKNGEPLRLVDPQAGILQDELGERLQVDHWRG